MGNDELICQIHGFKTADFGSITPLTSPFPAPPVYPRAGVHPRLLLTPEILPDIIRNLTHPENAAMYAKYREQSESESDGRLAPIGEKRPHNMDVNLLTIIEAKAFRYLVEQDERYGYTSILMLKNFLLTLDVPRGSMFDACRAFGYAMYTAALVYDWCFDLMTDEDRAELTAAVESRLAPRFEMGFPPLGQGGVVGHGTEAQLYRDWLAYAIASCDEYPDIYNLIVGRLFATHRDAAEFYMRSGAHWQGGSYGTYRYHYLLMPQILLSRMTGGRFDFFSENLHRVAYFLLHTIRPDEIDYPMGDGKGTIAYRAAPIFLAASIYRDPVLKGFSKTYLRDFTVWMNQTFSTVLTPVMFLCLNDPTLDAAQNYTEHLPLVLYNGSPRGQITARSSWKSKDAASIYMKIGEAYSANHEHKDAGHFMIYYKAPLATDSGVYNARYGCRHDCDYLKQTISHNCMLVYNPKRGEEMTTKAYHFNYSGGQRIGVESEPFDLLDWARKGCIHQAETIGAEYETLRDKGEEKYLWSYLAGDLTNAYDAETVESYCRYMFSVMTDDERYPMAFFVFDRMTATDPTFKKTFLLHTLAAPTVDHKNQSATVVYQDGKLRLESLLTEVDYEVIGGLKGEVVDGKVNREDRQFWLNGKNYYAEDNPDYKIPETIEAGWGRIEISPRENEKTTRLLHVMTVTDAENGDLPVKAREIKGEGLVGAEILGKTVLFPSDERLLTHGGRLETVASSEESEYFILGLRAGRWSVSLGENEPTVMTVSDKGVLRFVGKHATLSLTPLEN